MSFRKEMKENATLFLFILMGIVGALSEDIRSLLEKNAVIVIPFFLLIAIAELKTHLDNIVQDIIRKD